MIVDRQGDLSEWVSLLKKVQERPCPGRLKLVLMVISRIPLRALLR